MLGRHWERFTRTRPSVPALQLVFPVPPFRLCLPQTWGKKRNPRQHLGDPGSYQGTFQYRNVCFVPETTPTSSPSPISSSLSCFWSKCLQLCKSIKYSLKTVFLPLNKPSNDLAVSRSLLVHGNLGYTITCWDEQKKWSRLISLGKYHCHYQLL